MKITWKPNPLHTVIELDDGDKRELRLKILVEELRWRVHGAAYHLKTSGDIEKAQRELDLDGMEERVDTVLSEYVLALAGTHIGDCTCVPCSCDKCHAEDLLGINTIAGLGKHQASKIGAAFNGGDGRDLEAAIAWLADYHPDREAGPDSWKHRNPDLWAAHSPRWIAEAKSAHKWLEEYRDAHPSRHVLGDGK